MKIEWIDVQREVPGIGLLGTGDVRDIDENLALSLIRQNQAVAVDQAEIEEETEG